MIKKNKKSGVDVLSFFKCKNEQNLRESERERGEWKGLGVGR